MAGAEGFEPSNTGSKVPRLTAWPRPTVTIPGAFQSWRYGSTGVAELPSANREFIRWAALTATFRGIYRGARAWRDDAFVGTQSAVGSRQSAVGRRTDD